MYFDEASHCVTSIEGALRTAKYVNTFNIGIIEVES